MSFSDDAAKTKLSALAETQESIVAVAQWFMFHKRHADRTATLWLQRLKESSSQKSLNLIYLANEVIQQSKARKTESFLNAFSPIIADATEFAYKGASHDIQQKLRRVVEVWRQRAIFDPAVQAGVESKIDGNDKTQARPSAAKKPMLGGSLFSAANSSSIPVELAPLVPLQQSLSKASLAASSTTTKTNSDYAALNGSTTALPTPPVLAARLSALVKTLASAEEAVAESLKTRRALIEGLERLLESQRTDLAREEKQHQDLTTKRETMTRRRHQVEDQIMRGLATETPQEEPARPEIESFTPPPDDIGSTTPSDPIPGYAPVQADGGPDVVEIAPESSTKPHSATLEELLASTHSLPATTETMPAPQTSLDPRRRPAVKADVVQAPEDVNSTATMNGQGEYEGHQAKKRKMHDEYAGAGQGEVKPNAMDGLDADVVGLLG